MTHAAGSSLAIAQVQPLYLTVVKQLAAEIARGAVAPGDRLPGERELCRHFNVSRVTIRRALGELRQRGLIEADGSRGWFVTSVVLGEPNALMSFSEMARSRGLVPSARVLQAVVRAATIDEAEELMIAPGLPIFALERVRLLDGVAVALECSRLPLNVAPELPRADLSQGSLYDALRRAGVIPTRADYLLQAIPAEQRHAAALEVEIRAPLLMASARTFEQTGRPIELSVSVFRGDRYRFRATLFKAGRDGSD
ncbi:MAG TPA: GntR family transcriptional regulator [Dongiaceae bacterium]|nr:GntR family transcriptional regulator [Dongiaceae bacterium]